jgi:hypothetical protein
LGIRYVREIYSSFCEFSFISENENAVPVLNRIFTSTVRGYFSVASLIFWFRNTIAFLSGWMVKLSFFVWGLPS